MATRKRAAGHYVVDGTEPIVTLHETRVFVICTLKQSRISYSATSSTSTRRA
jgi:hypothetical protein